jgi:hypothetical protein
MVAGDDDRRRHVRTRDLNLVSLAFASKEQKYSRSVKFSFSSRPWPLACMVESALPLSTWMPESRWIDLWTAYRTIDD